jgi:hypothetical protein
MSIDEREVKRGPGRPRTNKEDERATRPERISMAELGGKLTVLGKSPDHEYYWAFDSDASGHNCLRFKLAGWEFCTNDEGLVVGDAFVYNTSTEGSVYRVPADKQGGYLFLMKIRKDWYDEDFKKAQKKIDDREKGLFNPNKGDGQYGRSGYDTE